MTYADVALPIPGSKPLTYLVPDEFKQATVPGVRVKVPIGMREMTGWVVKLRSETEVTVKPIKEVLDLQSSLSQELIELTAWVSDYYRCAWGEAIKTALPPRFSTRQHPMISLGPKQQMMVGHPEAGTLIPLLEARGEISEKHALRVLGQNSLKKIKTLIGTGILERRLTWQKSVGPKFQRWLVFVKKAELPARAFRQKALLDMLEERKELKSSPEISAAPAEGLVKRGLARWESRRVDRIYEIPSWEDQSFDHQLTPDQDQALGQIVSDLNAGTFRVNLIQGVTGSGKTELYLRAATRTLELGKGVLILVPEIGLTGQMISRVVSRFPDAAVWHSGLSQGERLDVWEGIRQGRHKVVVGTRSAVFAPMPRIGLIVVDEEQDSSYKQSEVRPYYHARDVAIMRASRTGASVIMGSATPAVETYYKARNGKFRLFTWEQRTGQSGLPKVELVDVRSSGGGRGLISEPLQKALREVMADGQQAMLLFNRRGYAPYIQCRQCGHIIRCPNCSISLSFHRMEGKMLCHYCGHSRRLPDCCPSCRHPELASSGQAIQVLEQQLKELFPGIGILRMDADTTSAKGGHHRILDKFIRGEARILVGTQMIAKGHDFPNVTLVGIINADDLLGIPDFRAQERAFQLITQMSGRSGRGGLAGRVIVQTRSPENPVMKWARQHDYQAFWSEEMRERKEHGYPPFNFMVLLTVSSPDERSGEKQALRLAEAIGGIDSGSHLMGPVPAPVFRLKGRYRWQLVMKATHKKILNDSLDRLQDLPRQAGIRLSVDVDPASLS